ncbi:Arc family DNA-binding protein [Rhizobium cremeum]|uniref:Arc family DNA-binding protein n=1 Tax=Rhizobium cremeum TaxID=2813827 RepID=UPI0039E107A8
MAKKTKVKDYDQFQLRLPPGMRDRIKAQAERMGMSMNEAVVHCLEEYFPKPASFEDRIEHLAELVAALKDGSDLEDRIDEITAEIDSTLHDIYADKVIVTAGFAERVAQHVEAWATQKEEERKRFGIYGEYEEDVSGGVEEPPFSGIGDPFEDGPRKGEEN